MPVTTRAALSFGGTFVYLAVAVLGYGSISGFFSRPPLVGLTLVFLALGVAAFFAGGSMSPGVREARDNRWVIPAVSVLGMVSAFVPAWTERIDFWMIGGDAIAWFGVALTAIGGTLRILPVYILGNRFSGLVAIQPGHTLVTSGLYGAIRHPSYLGLLLTGFGWALSFRSGVGVLLAALMIPLVIARMRSEEALLASEFGSEYQAYRARTSRLLPGIY
jgi:protein-S-isoprenylcysteine O-methyltransferase Ste14